MKVWALVEAVHVLVDDLQEVAAVVEQQTLISESSTVVLEELCGYDGSPSNAYVYQKMIQFNAHHQSMCLTISCREFC
jgi:hypothetical protein